MRRWLIVLFVVLTVLQLLFYSLDAFHFLPEHSRVINVLAYFGVPGFIVLLFLPISPETFLGRPWLLVLFTIPPIFVNSVLYTACIGGLAALVRKFRSQH